MRMSITMIAVSLMVLLLGAALCAWMIVEVNAFIDLSEIAIERLNAQDTQAVRMATDEISAKWEKAQKALEVIAQHNDLDKVSTCLRLVESALEADDWFSTVRQCHELKAAFESLIYKELPHISNIF